MNTSFPSTSNGRWSRWNTALAASLLLALAVIVLYFQNSQSTGPLMQAQALISATPAATLPPPVSSAEPTTAAATVPVPVASAVTTLVPITPQVSPTLHAIPENPQPGEVEVARGDFGSWNFRAARKSTQPIMAGVSYNRGSIEELKAYAITNKSLAAELVRQGSARQEVYITFNTYIDTESFRQWAKRFGLQNTHTDIRYIDGSGLLATMSIVGTQEDPLPQSLLDERLQSAASQEGIRSFKGVFFTLATVRADRLLDIASDSRVFLCDVTTNVVRNELRSAGIAESDVQQAYVVINMPPTPFWDMEKFGLGNFR